VNLPKIPVPSPAWPGLFLRVSCALLAGASGAYALGEEDVGTSEFQYIETLIFARPAGMAGAFTAGAQGVDAVGFNPAGAAKADPGRTLSGTFRYHFLDVASGNASYAYPGADTSWSYVFSAAFINYGRIPEVDEEGNDVVSASKMMPASFNPSFTGARRVSDRLRLGASLRGFSEYLGDFYGSQLAWGWGVDAGLQYQPPAKNLGFGVALLNLGRKERAQLEGGKTGGMLPTTLKGGVFYSAPELPKARVHLDGELPLRQAARLSGGLEYAYAPSLTLRVGSRIDWSEATHFYEALTDAETGTWQGGNALKLTAGFTFAAEAYSVDYAVQYWQGLSWVHALTLKYAAY
jgi:hypothetical protein